jgi:hypothetical protein
MNQAKFVTAALATAVCSPAVFAQVFVNETFDYADQAALDVNWNLGANSPLSLNIGIGNPAPSAYNPATGTNPNIWAGSTFSLIPTDVNPIRLTADITSDGTAGSVTTVALRGGVFNFEMGISSRFGYVQTGPDTTAPNNSPANQNGFGVQTTSIGRDLPGNDWIKMGDNYTGPARFKATINRSGVITRVDLGIDGTWDLSYTEIGTNFLGAFTGLRIHAPATVRNGGANVDNLRLEVLAVPEPSTVALFALGALMTFGMLHRRKA